MSGKAGNNGSLRKNRWRVTGWGAAAVMLLLPLIAMQFTDEVDWDVSDFIIFGAMFAGLGHTILGTGFFVTLWLTSAWLFKKCREDATSQT